MATDSEFTSFLHRQFMAFHAEPLRLARDGKSAPAELLSLAQARLDQLANALAARVKQGDQSATPALSADDLRKWALEQFARLTQSVGEIQPVAGPKVPMNDLAIRSANAA